MEIPERGRRGRAREFQVATIGLPPVFQRSHARVAECVKCVGLCPSTCPQAGGDPSFIALNWAPASRWRSTNGDAGEGLVNFKSTQLGSCQCSSVLTSAWRNAWQSASSALNFAPRPVPAQAGIQVSAPQLGPGLSMEIPERGRRGRAREFQVATIGPRPFDGDPRTGTPGKGLKKFLKSSAYRKLLQKRIVRMCGPAVGLQSVSWCIYFCPCQETRRASKTPAEVVVPCVVSASRSAPNWTQPHLSALRCSLVCATSKCF
jgi:hypothetical protein